VILSVASHQLLGPEDLQSQREEIGRVAVTLNEIGEKEVPQLQDPAPQDHLDNLFIPTLEESWFKTAYRNFKETLNPKKLPPLELTSHAVEFHTSAEMMELPWYKSLFQGIKDTINPPKLPPLEVTSHAVEVPEIWSSNKKQGSLSFATAIGLEVVAVVLLFLLFTNKTVQQKIREHVTLIAPDLGQYKPKLPPKLEKAGGGGGGGMKAPEPVSKGTTPKFAPKQFIPPTQVTTPKPELPVAPTITAEAPKINMDQYGDPNAKNLPFSGGPGAGGLGSGHGGGIGNGDGNGFGKGSGGGMGGGVYRIGGSVSAPAILMKVEPEYSEEARKAKFQGTVVLMIVVDEKGMPRNIRVVRPLGLGLDEKAIEAVQRWRFKPGMKDGHAVATEATVEVNFRLL
jgi:protein TonB